MSRKDSNFIRILYEICQEEDIEIRSFSDFWGHKLYRKGLSCFIVGYQFPLNLASSKEIAQDKVLTYQMLEASHIPAVPHYFIPSSPYMDPDAIPAPEFPAELLKRDGVMVLKDNYGTGGVEVFRVYSLAEYEDTLSRIHVRSRAAALCPYVDIQEEYRVVMLDHEPQLIFRKERQKVLNENGEEVLANWRHNLGQGAVPVVVEEENLRQQLAALAQKVTETLHLRFCSVDLVSSKEGLQVLEVNGGVMMENFAGTNPAYYKMAKEIYRKAILKVLTLPKLSMEDLAYDQL